MPLTHLISPDDRSLTPLEDAVLGSLDPWYPRAYILEIAEGVRDYDGGKPHVTGLINGPRHEWLRGQVDYSVDPDDQAWAIVGSAGHYLLEKHGGIAEAELSNDYMQGRLDNLVAVNGTLGIEDYKVWGSFKIAKSLGLHWETQEVLGADGEPLRYGKRAKKAGQVKTRNVLVDGKRDVFDLRAQLNGYRILYEENVETIEVDYEVVPEPGKIDYLKAWLIAREGGTERARSYRLTRNVYGADIEIVRDGSVEEWFASRSEELQTAWAKGSPPRPCDAREAWGGRRCRGYCPVASQCREIGDNPW